MLALAFWLFALWLGLIMVMAIFSDEDNRNGLYIAIAVTLLLWIFR